MAAPTPLDYVSSGVFTATSPFNVALPTHYTGDLVIVSCATDASASAVYPTSGPNGETVIQIDRRVSSSQGLTSFAFIATADSVGSPVWAVTQAPSGPIACSAFRIAAGDFDPADTITEVDTNITTSSLPLIGTTSFIASYDDGRVFGVGAVDSDTVTGPHTSRAALLGTLDIGRVSSFVAYNTDPTIDGEWSFNFGVTFPSDTASITRFVVRPAPSWSGSFVKTATDSKARVRQHDTNAASVRLASGARL